ncbi:hypothetical protein FOMPIDRAFT_145120 [Fomitopsis schrenkii]|uniref:Aminoglycoside phosphotransferase domain-containing protein n=1 Tax=Fomitopsis schrenkii TaxID=2126942 RepID=S8FKF2_FOMSC|nr:hypothetical protein FOMPIDRAFT_145120 [Fomitopsis schrenkii]
MEGFSSQLLCRVLSVKPIWELAARAVIQISEDIVVKVGRHQDHDEHAILRFVEEHCPAVPAPRALGLVTVASTSFLFMTLVAGDTLEKRWPMLSGDEKMHIRHTLDAALLTIHALECPCDAPLGSPAGQRLCKDVRRHERVSAISIYSEAQFNDLLLESPSSRPAPGFKRWLRSMLQDDHRIVFTHGDFHPRNIMVVDRPDGSIELSGILDWECSGFYPEYWEQLKALNTRSTKDTDDWWDHLPPSILGYDHEVVLDRLIESAVVY